MAKRTDVGPFVLRLFLGLLFFVAGVMKLFNAEGIIGMLGGLGFPAAAFFGWVVILSEVLCGAFLLLGWQLRYAVWPPVVILVVAILTVHLPAMTSGPMGVPNLLLHLVALAGLVSLFYTGPGRFALA